MDGRVKSMASPAIGEGYPGLKNKCFLNPLRIISITCLAFDCACLRWSTEDDIYNRIEVKLRPDSTELLIRTDLTSISISYKLFS